MYSALLDTDIFSDILKGYNPTVRSREKSYLARFDRYALSVITIMEIVKGLHKSGREDRILAFRARLQTAEILAMDQPCAELAGRICADMERTGQPIGYADPIIAAIAIRHDVTLVTANVSHYDRIRRMGYPLRLDNWREPVESS